MYSFKIESFDENDQRIEIVVTAATEDVAKAVAMATTRNLRGSGLLNGGSQITQMSVNIKIQECE
jgi:hypothetical protein